MFLMTEYLDNTTEWNLVEDKKTGKKQLYIEGIYMQDTVVNKNGRSYPREVMSVAVDEFTNQRIQPKIAYGELNHPPSPAINPDRVSHRIVSLIRDGNDIIGKSIVLDTPTGNIVRAMVETDGKIGVSSRGLGALKKTSAGINEVQTGWKLATVDVVTDPSAPSAFVNGIMEGVEWIMEGGILTAKEVSDVQDRIHKTKKVDLDRTMVQIFQEIMESITKSKYTGKH